MKSRMAKYSKQNISENQSRLDKNQKLYSKVYSVGHYELKDNFTVLSNTNELNLNKINELVANREDYQRILKYKNLVEKPPIEEERVQEVKDITSFDINEMLIKAKENKKVKAEDKYKKLADTEYNILKDLEEVDTTNSKRPLISTQASTPEIEEELRDLINTITMSAVDEEEIKRLEAKEKEQQETNIIEEIKKDPDFFTNSLVLSTKDFESNKQVKKEPKKLKKVLKVIGWLLGVGIVFIILVIMSKVFNIVI